jgi:hypothetical protein
MKIKYSIKLSFTLTLITISIMLGTVAYATAPSSSAVANSGYIASPPATSISVSVTPTGSTSPLTLSSSSPVKLSTAATFSETITSVSPVTGVSYYLGSKLLSTVTTSPYSYSFNTKSYLNGNYSLKTKTYFLNGKTSSSTESLVVANPYSWTQLRLSIDHSALVVAIVLVVILCSVLYLLRSKLKLALKTRPKTKTAATTGRVVVDSDGNIATTASSDSNTYKSQRAKSLIPILLIVIGISILGHQLLSDSHAATPYGSVEAISGALTGGALKSSDGASVVFGKEDTTTTTGGSNTTGATGGSAPALPSGLTGTFVSTETGAQLYADSGWQKSTNGNLTPSSGCVDSSPATITASGTYLDLYTPASSSWDCAGIESNATVVPGHIYQLREYIPAAANGNIADYASWWVTDSGWNMEFDMAESHDWGDTTPIPGQICLDIHLDQGTENTSPNCLNEAGGWHVWTADWAANGDLTMYYDGTKASPQGPTGSSLTDGHMIIWNDNNGGSGTVNSTVQVDYLAEWTTN